MKKYATVASTLDGDDLPVVIWGYEPKGEEIKTLYSSEWSICKDNINYRIRLLIDKEKEMALNRCWVVRGAEAHRAFVNEDEARAFAGDWGKVIPMIEEI